MLLPQLLELDRGQVAKRTVKTFVIVFLSPPLDEEDASVAVTPALCDTRDRVPDRIRIEPARLRDTLLGVFRS